MFKCYLLQNEALKEEPFIFRYIFELLFLFSLSNLSS